MSISKESIKDKKIIISKIKHFLYPQKATPNDKFQKFSMVYIITCKGGMNYQYFGANMSDGFMPFTAELASTLDIGEAINITYMPIAMPSGRNEEKEYINKIIKIKRA